MKNRMISLLLVLCMMLTVIVPFSVVADPGVDGGLCLHHTQHTAACGYVEGDADSPCTNACALCVTVGDFTICATEGGSLTLGTDYTYSDHVLTVCSATGITVAGKTTQDRIEVASGVDAQVTLAGVDIDVSGNENAAAFKIADDSTGNVTVVLASGTENSLISGKNCAGLQKNGDGEDIGTLTIRGEGALTVRCKGEHHSFGAGIGGGNHASTANIRIIGASITATSLDGAGIGGGYGGNLTNIVIEDSVVNATSYRGAGIGGGVNGDGRPDCNLTNITIENSVVNATSHISAGIGGGLGMSNNGNLTNITVKGSSIRARGVVAIGNGDGTAVNPTDGDGKPLYLLTLNNPDDKPIEMNGKS